MNINQIGMFLIIMVAGIGGLILFIWLGNLILNSLKIPAPNLTPGKMQEDSQVDLNQPWLEPRAGGLEPLMVPIPAPLNYQPDKQKDLLSQNIKP